jgi:hypothetical protein
MCSPDRSPARSARPTPVRCSSDRHPCTATVPFVVPDSARMASARCTSRSSAGRPSPAPPRTVPFAWRRYSTAPDGTQLTPLTAVPAVSSNGPTAAIFSATVA